MQLEVSPEGVFRYFLRIMGQAYGPLDLIIAVIVERKMLFTVIMGIMVMEERIRSAMQLYS